MEREKPSSILTFLCTADNDAAVHGSKMRGVSSEASLPLGVSSGGSKSGNTSGTYKESDCCNNDIAAFNNNNNVSLIDYNQVEGIWPVEHPLPLPAWSNVERSEFGIKSTSEFNDIAGVIESQLQSLLEEHNYNTVGNFISLYEGFKKSSCSSLVEFFQSYVPPITANHHTCVGLAIELWKKVEILNKNHPGLTSYFYLVSCEESIGVFNEYPGLYDSIEEVSSIMEKEHVLLALKFKFNERSGIMLCDPGYHVGRVIIIMKDNMLPHTGWFTQSSEKNVKKEYMYKFSDVNDGFIEWYDKTTKNQKIEEIHSLVYIKRPYLTAVDVTERRNLVYSFRSLLSRDQKGHLIAGIYFKVTDTSDEFTLFYEDAGKQRIKLNFAEFLNVNMVNERILNIITKCNSQMNLKENELIYTLNTLYNIFNDKNYLQQLLDINNCINNMTEIE